MIKSKIVYVQIGGDSYLSLDPDLSKIDNEINAIGKENIFQITCASCTSSGNEIVYTIFYDDGQ